MGTPRFALSIALLVTIMSAPILTAQTFMVNSHFLFGGDFISINRGDFNNDGILDLITPAFKRVVINSNGDSVPVPYIAVFLGNGDGTFMVPALSILPEGASDIAVGDFNHDGHLDIATINLGKPRVSVLLGNGDGSLSLKTVLQVPSATGALSLTAGDFNGDGNLDIAVGYGNPLQPGETLQPGTIDELNTIAIFPGDGRGNFGAPIKVSGFGNRAIQQIRVADFNADGKQDIALTTDNEVIALLGDGNFGFSPNVLGTYFAVVDATPTDVNQDGATDLLVSFLGCGGSCAAIDVYLSTGPNHVLERSTTISVTPSSGNAPGLAPTLTTQAKQTSTSRIVSSFQANAARRPAAVDINGDGINDIVANYFDSSQTLDEVVTWLGKPDGTFEEQPHRWVLETEGLSELVPGDFNRDGKIEIATTNVSDSTINVLLNSTPKAACNPSTQFSTVTMCTPQDLAFLNSPVRVVAVSTPEPPVVGNPIVAGQLYVDNVLAQQIAGTQIDTFLNMPAGDHLVVAKFWDSVGGSSQTVRHISVFSGAAGETCPASPQRMTICAPASNGTFSTPLHVFAAVMANAPVTAFQVFIDDRLVNSDLMHDTYIDTAFPVAPGPHKVVVQAFDAQGVVYQDARDVVIQ
jgi:hypothetical protein